MSPKKSVVVQVSGLAVHRGRTTILNDFSWRVELGEHWVILGANGSGKTSLLSALTGYLTPSEGEIRVLSQRYGETDWRELRRRVGLVSSAVKQMMPESEPALATVISGRSAVIDYWGRPTSNERAQAMRILRRIECGYLSDRPWAFLSQGERQRILIGRALMAEPALLILDEPCAGLDPVAREHFLQFLDRLGKTSGAPTLVLVTHHVEEIMPVFTHALLMREGRLFAAGERARVLTSRMLSGAFGCALRLKSDQGRLRLVIPRKTRAIV